MQCQICDKEIDGIFICDRCGKRVCRDCTSSIGENTLCKNCLAKRQDALKNVEAPQYQKILGRGSVIIIIAFWVLAGVAYLALPGLQAVGNTNVPQTPPPKTVEIVDYVPVCDPAGMVYALELSLTNTGTKELAVDSIIINDRSMEYSGKKKLAAGEAGIYRLPAQNIFGNGFSKTSAPRGAKVLVTTDQGSTSRMLTTNPAACVQK